MSVWNYTVVREQYLFMHTEKKSVQTLKANIHHKICCSMGRAGALTIQVNFLPTGPPWRPLSSSFLYWGWPGCLGYWLLIATPPCLLGCLLSSIPHRFVYKVIIIYARAYQARSIIVYISIRTMSQIQPQRQHQRHQLRLFYIKNAVGIC